MKAHRVIKLARAAGAGRVAYTNTSRIPDAEVVRELRALAHDVDISRTVFHFKRLSPHSRTYGRAYDGIPPIANLDGLRRGDWRYLVVVRDSSAWVWTLAHEAKHIEQYRERKPRSEVAAEAYAEWWVERRRSAARTR